MSYGAVPVVAMMEEEVVAGCLLFCETSRF